jgi:hypothetical protein
VNALLQWRILRVSWNESQAGRSAREDHQGVSSEPRLRIATEPSTLLCSPHSTARPCAMQVGALPHQEGSRKANVPQLGKVLETTGEAPVTRSLNGRKVGTSRSSSSFPEVAQWAIASRLGRYAS